MNLISFSVYGPAPRYWHGALRNAVIAAETWPGWTCRFYCDRQNRTTDALDKMPNCQVLYRHDPRPGVGMLWRFEAAADPTADYIIFRDADSRLSRREHRAVDEWILSETSYHIIRDHPAHRTPFMRGGLWGVWGPLHPNIETDISLWLVKRPLKPRHLDEEFLNEVIAPEIVTLCLHQSPAHFVTCPNDTTAFIGQSFDEHDHPLN